MPQRPERMPPGDAADEHATWPPTEVFRHASGFRGRCGHHQREHESPGFALSAFKRRCVVGFPQEGRIARSRDSHNIC